MALERVGYKSTKAQEGKRARRTRTLADSVHVLSAICLAFFFQLSVFSSLRDLLRKYHCLKSVSIQSNSGQYFSVFSRIRTDYGEIRSILS